MAILLAAVTGLASAADVGLEYKNYNGVNGGADAEAYSLFVAGQVANGIKADVKFQSKQDDGTKALSNRLEAGLTGTTELYGPVSGYIRGAVGEKFTNGNDYGYYSIEPGVAAKLGHGFGASLGWRYRDAFNDANGDQTRTWRAKVGYDLTKQDNVYIGYDRQRGDSEYNAWRIGYVRSF